MIKVLVEHRVRKGADILPLLKELRAQAIQYPGFVGAEVLLNAQDISKIILATTWQRVQDWRLWETSHIRVSLYKRAEELLVDEPKVGIYGILAIHRWG